MAMNNPTTAKPGINEGELQEWDVGESVVPGVLDSPSWWGKKRSAIKPYLGSDTLLMILMAFFLGRATILTGLSPFSIGLYAAVLRVRPRLAWLVGVLTILGAFSTGVGGGRMAATTLCELALYKLLTGALTRQRTLSANVIPVLAFLVAAAVHTAETSLGGDLSEYGIVMSLVDGFLALILSMIFLQSMPIFMFLRGVKRLRTEEIVSLVIVLASFLTGFKHLSVHGIALEDVFSRYLIMVLALVGGAGIGGGVGVVTGVVLSVSDLGSTSQIGLLAFSGVLGGLLREAKKLGVAIGFVIGTAILTIYVHQLSDVWEGLIETGVAVILLYLTPKSLIEGIARYVPGTTAHALSQHEYARRARDLMTGRIREVSDVFQELAKTFRQLCERRSPSEEDAAMRTLDVVSSNVCAGCRKRTQCWEQDFNGTYRALFDTMALMHDKGPLSSKDAPQELRRRCIRIDTMMPNLHTVMDMARREMDWEQRVEDGRTLIASQLEGVSRIMGELSDEITRENTVTAAQEEGIVKALERLGLSVQEVEIISLDEGRTEIEVTQPSAADYEASVKLIAPLLSEIVGENIVMVEHQIDEQGGTCTSRFRSGRAFQVRTGVAYAAKDGKALCGDSHAAIDVGNGKFALALSDGMGNGERAMQESSAALRLMQQLLKAGFDERLVIRTVNSALLLRSEDEMYATVDLALIDLFSARAEFLKIGSVPSLIMRNQEIRAIGVSNVPIGILQDIEIQSVEETLRAGDILVMVSDGIYDAPRHMTDKEEWLRRQLMRMGDGEPQKLADSLLEAAVRLNNGRIVDDMTVVVAKVEEYHPQWAKIRLPGMPPIERTPRAPKEPVLGA